MSTYASNDLSIRFGLLDDLLSLKHIADENRDALGFLPRSKLMEAIDGSRILVAALDNCIVGFVVFRHRKRDGQTTLSDLCVATSLRRQGIARALVEALKLECVRLGRHYIRLKCPGDLSANDFYNRLGFTHVAVESGRVRPLNVWHLETTRPQTE